MTDFIDQSAAAPAQVVSSKPAEDKPEIKEEVAADAAPVASPEASSGNWAPMCLVWSQRDDHRVSGIDGVKLTFKGAWCCVCLNWF